MTKANFFVSAVAALALTNMTVASALAQTPHPGLPGSPDPAAVRGGSYQVEPDHTQVAFSVVHLGLSDYGGVFSNVSGELKLDPTSLGATSVEVTVPVDSVMTTSKKLDDELKSAQWLDAAAYPNMRFRSTRIVRTGPTTADLEGDLTLHGTTHPVVLKARFVGAGTNPIDKSYTIGFRATGIIRRTEFGVTMYAPLISDETELTINAVFHSAP